MKTSVQIDVDDKQESFSHKDVAQDMAAAKELFNCDSGMLAFDKERAR